MMNSNQNGNGLKMAGKVSLITGANRGIGRATALGMARMGATVVIVSRNRELGIQARDEIRAESGNPAVELLVADLASQAQIRRLADEFKSRNKQLHVLVNNAGVVKKERTVTAEGLEYTFAVNHLAPFLLTNLLLDVLVSSAPARVINVSSMVHKWGEIDFDDLQGQRDYDMDKAYNQSKLANVLFSRELARRLQGTGVTVNSVEPGMTATDFGREYTGFKAFMTRTWRIFMNSPEEGADTIVYLAANSEVANISGEHFVNRKPVKSSKATYDEVLARWLWLVSADLTDIHLEEPTLVGMATRP